MNAGLDQAFSLAVAELGMATAGWLFAAEVAEEEGLEGVQRLRDALGRRWPVLDAVCAAWERGLRPPPVDASQLWARLGDVGRVVFVGLEARWLDAFVARRPADVRIGLIRHSELSPDWERVRANLGEAVELVDLDAFQAWGGRRSAVVSFVYGDGGRGLFALSTWVRVSGPDVRTQFRSLVGWDVLRVPLSVYPRWLVAVPPSDFTEVER
jgi:hypothetical protein